MCTSTRLIYTLTYRALREFASGRKSTNPIEVLHQMETSVPFSVCSHTHRIMMLALRSFDQRVLVPVGVHEPISWLNINKMNVGEKAEAIALINARSYLRHETPAGIQNALRAARNRLYAHRATGYWGHLRKLESTEWIIAHNLFLPPFKVSLQV